MVTNLTKLAGVAVFLNETLIRGDTRVQVIATCVLFVMGAQAFESMTIRIIDHIFQR